VTFTAETQRRRDAERSRVRDQMGESRGMMHENMNIPLSASASLRFKDLWR
jgi:hypothetical protein